MYGERTVRQIVTVQRPDLQEFQEEYDVQKKI